MKTKYTLLLHFLVVPCSAVLENTKYKISNITKSLILDSSPFLGRDLVPVEYGSPSLGGEYYAHNDEYSSDENKKSRNSDVEESRIHEVRVAPPNPFMDETNRNGKSLEDQRKWWVLLNIMSCSLLIFYFTGPDLNTSLRSHCIIWIPNPDSSRKHLRNFQDFSHTHFQQRMPPKQKLLQ